MLLTRKYIDYLSFKVIGCAIEVHKQLGPGLLESIYERCFLHELTLQGLNYQDQFRICCTYKGLSLDTELRCDVIVENSVIVELKSVDKIQPIHQAISLTYMRMLNIPKGIIINFNCEHIFKFGQMTLVNNLYAQLPEG